MSAALKTPTELAGRKPTTFQNLKRNPRHRRAGLAGMRVSKVEKAARKTMRRSKAQLGLFTGIAAVQDAVAVDLLRRATAHCKPGKILRAKHLALALQEPGCLAARHLKCRRIAGIQLSAAPSK